MCNFVKEIEIMGEKGEKVVSPYQNKQACPESTLHSGLLRLMSVEKLVFLPHL